MGKLHRLAMFGWKGWLKDSKGKPKVGVYEGSSYGTIRGSTSYRETTPEGPRGPETVGTGSPNDVDGLHVKTVGKKGGDESRRTSGGELNTQIPENHNPEADPAVLDVKAHISLGVISLTELAVAGEKRDEENAQMQARNDVECMSTYSQHSTGTHQAVSSSPVSEGGLSRAMSLDMVQLTQSPHLHADFTQETSRFEEDGSLEGLQNIEAVEVGGACHALHLNSHEDQSETAVDHLSDPGVYFQISNSMVAGGDGEDRQEGRSESLEDMRMETVSVAAALSLPTDACNHIEMLGCEGGVAESESCGNVSEGKVGGFSFATGDAGDVAEGGTTDSVTKKSEGDKWGEYGMVWQDMTGQLEHMKEEWSEGPNASVRRDDASVEFAEDAASDGHDSAISDTILLELPKALDESSNWHSVAAESAVACSTSPPPSFGIPCIPPVETSDQSPTQKLSLSPAVPLQVEEDIIKSQGTGHDDEGKGVPPGQENMKPELEGGKLHSVSVNATVASNRGQSQLSRVAQWVNSIEFEFPISAEGANSSAAERRDKSSFLPDVLQASDEKLRFPHKSMSWGHLHMPQGLAGENDAHPGGIVGGARGRGVAGGGSIMAPQGGNADAGMEHALRVLRSLDRHAAAVYLSSRGLSVLPPLLSFSCLKTLDLSRNLLGRLQSGILPKTLHILDLSHNRLGVIEGLRDLSRLRVLNLSNNRLTRVGHGLAGCVSLREVYLGVNKVSEVEGFHRLLKLSVVDLSGNKITTTKALGQLAANHGSLKALNLIGNPINVNLGEDAMRKYISGLLPQLLYLNQKPIKPLPARDVVKDVKLRGGHVSSRSRTNTRSAHKSTSGATKRALGGGGATSRSASATRHADGAKGARSGHSGGRDRERRDASRKSHGGSALAGGAPRGLVTPLAHAALSADSGIAVTGARIDVAVTQEVLMH